MAQNTKDYETLYVVSVCCFFTSLGQHILAGGEIRPESEQCFIRAGDEQHRRQSEFSFFFDDAAVKNISNITLDVRNARIEEVLAACLKGTGFSFRILDKTIILFREQPQTVEQQKFYKVQGKVVDEKNLPMPVLPFC